MNIKKFFLFGILPLFALGLFFVDVDNAQGISIDSSQIFISHSYTCLSDGKSRLKLETSGNPMTSYPGTTINGSWYQSWYGGVAPHFYWEFPWYATETGSFTASMDDGKNETIDSFAVPNCVKPTIKSVATSCSNGVAMISVNSVDYGDWPLLGEWSFNGGASYGSSYGYNCGGAGCNLSANSIYARWYDEVAGVWHVSNPWPNAISFTCSPTTPNMSFVKDVGRGKGWVTSLGGIAADGMNVYKYDTGNATRATIFTQGTAFTAGTSFSNVTVYSLSCPRKYVFEAVAFNTLTGGATCPSAYSLSNKLCSPVRYVTTTIDYCTHHQFGF